MNKVKWTSKKPLLNKECLLLTATKINAYWEYNTWIIGKCENYETGGWYLGILTGDGEEWGNIDELAAQKYCVMPLIKTPKS